MTIDLELFALAVPPLIAGVTSIIARARDARRGVELAESGLTSQLESATSDLRLIESATTELEPPHSPTPPSKSQGGDTVTHMEVDKPSHWSESLIQMALDDQKKQGLSLHERAQERYAASRRLATLAAWVGVLSMLIVMTATILILLSLVPQGAASVVGGTLVAAASALVFSQSKEAKRDAQRDEDAMRREFDGQRRLALGRALVQDIANPDKRDDTLARLAVEVAQNVS